MIGTRLMLIIGYDFIFMLNILLLISILTSLLNIIIIKYYSKSHQFKYENNFLKNLFLICAPSIFVGTLLLKVYQNEINFGIIVSIIIIIIFSILIKLKFQKKFNKFLKNSINGLYYY